MRISVRRRVMEAATVAFSVRFKVITGLVYGVFGLKVFGFAFFWG